MRYLLVLSVTMFISACTTQNAKHQDAAAQAPRKVLALDNENFQNRIVSPENFAQATQRNVDENVVLGPQVAEVKDSELRNGSRVRIAEEQPQSYMELEGTEANDVFPVSLAFENVNMLAVAQMLSEVTGVNILVGDEVQQSLVTAKLVNVPWDRALDAILKTKGLAKHVDHRANIIRIHNQDTLVALEDFDRKRAEDMRKSIEAKRAVEPRYTEVFRLFYTDPDTLKSEVESVFGATAEASAVGDAGPQITVDKRINSLIVKGTNSELALVHRLIEEVDVRTRQILIEAFVVEATDNFEEALGARLGATGSLSRGSFNASAAGIAASTGSLVLGEAAGSVANLPVTSPTGGLGLLLATSSAALKFELTAMEKEGLSKIVSNPRIFTLDNEEAVVFQGEQIPYASQAEGGGTDVSFKDAGIKLTVTPSIVGDGNVVLDVHVTKDSPNRAYGDNPPIDKREVITKLLVKDRTVAVIGGVFKQEKSRTQEKVPLLGDIPVVGNMFKRDAQEDQRTELLIFLAPHII